MGDLLTALLGGTAGALSGANQAYDYSQQKPLRDAAIDAAQLRNDNTDLANQTQQRALDMSTYGTLGSALRGRMEQGDFAGVAQGLRQYYDAQNAVTGGNYVGPAIHGVQVPDPTANGAYDIDTQKPLTTTSYNDPRTIRALAGAIQMPMPATSFQKFGNARGGVDDVAVRQEYGGGYTTTPIGHSPAGLMRTGDGGIFNPETGQMEYTPAPDPNAGLQAEYLRAQIRSTNANANLRDQRANGGTGEMDPQTRARINQSIEATIDKRYPKTTIEKATGTPNAALETQRNAIRQQLNDQAFGAKPEAAGAIPTPVNGKYSASQWGPTVAPIAEANGVPYDLAMAVLNQESGGNPRITSKAGAQGLFQLMPGTAKDLGVTDSMDPIQNIKGGMKYMGSLLKTYNGDATKALAAYNAGPGAVEKYGGVPPYAETQNYVKSISAARSRWQTPAAGGGAAAPGQPAPTTAQDASKALGIKWRGQ